MSRIYNIRASSWARLFDCAMAWEGEQLMGLFRASSPRALLGKAFHAGTAAFDKASMLGQPITIDDAAEVVHQTVFGNDEPVDWSADRAMKPRNVEAIALGLHSLYCSEWSPRFQFEAVEQTVKPMEIDCGGGIVIRLTGTLDRMRAVRRGTGRGVQDLKSGSRVLVKGGVPVGKHKPQLGTYELLYEHTTGLAITEPAEIIGASTSGAPEIAVGTASNCKTVLVGEGDQPGLIQHAADMFTTGRFPPNPQSTLCKAAYCSRWAQCRYHD